MLRGSHPEMLQLLANLCAGSDVPAWEEETEPKKAKDTVLAREVAKRRKLLNDKKTAGSM